MVTVSQIEKYLPEKIEIKPVNKKVDGHSQVFMGLLPDKEIVFSICFTDFDKRIFGDGEDVSEELIKSRTELAHKQWRKRKQINEESL